MFRCLLVVAGLCAALCPWAPLAAAGRNELIAETTAVRHGLTRPWFVQAQIDAGQARVTAVVLDEGTLFVQTDRSTLTAIDAETGQTLWAKQVGRPDQPTMTPGLSRDLVAVINGSRLYAINRHNGQLLYEVLVGGAPGAGAAVSNKRAYVPMISGMVMAYRLQSLDEPAKELGKVASEQTAGEKAGGEAQRRENLRLRKEQPAPLYCQSLGRAMVQPLVTRQTDSEEYVVWATDLGYVNMGRLRRQTGETFAILFRLRSDSLITTRPTYMPPDPEVVGDSGVIYATTINGYVYAIREKDGNTLWRFPTADPIVQPAVVIDQRVYVAVETGGMYCLDAKSGKNLWAKSGSDLWCSPGITQFIAASTQRVYAVDKLGRLLVLSAASGARLDTVLATASPIRVINSETDRLYLATDTGLVQCLHELEQSQPLAHNENRKQAAASSPESKGPQEKHPKKPATSQEAEKPPEAEPAGESPTQPEKKPAAQSGPAEDPFAAPAAAAKGPAPTKGGSGGGPKKGPAKGDQPAGGNAGSAPDDPFAPDAKAK